MQKSFARDGGKISYVTEYKRSGLFRKSVLIFLMFMFIYSFPIISSINSLTSTRVASVAILFWGFFSQNKLFVIQIGNNNAEKSFQHYLFINLVLLLYTSFVLILWGEGTGEKVTNIYINILTFSIAFYFGCRYIFRDVEELMQILLIVTLIQCLIVFASLFSTEVYSWLRTNFYSNSFFELSGKLSSMKGYALGIGCITSKGSQKISLGIVACVYFVLKKKKNTLYLVLMLFITLASTAVSRTGIIYTVIAILYLLMIAIKKAPKKAKSILGKIVLVMLIAIGFVFVFNLKSLLENIFWRLSVLLQGGGNSFFSAYFKGADTVIPGISIETLVGTGIWSGMSGCGLMINADGGYVRTYFALGLVMSVIYYVFFGLNYIWGTKKLNNIEKNVSILFFIFILLGEFKEPLLFDWYYQTIIFVYIYWAEKNVRRDS